MAHGNRAGCDRSCWIVLLNKVRILEVRLSKILNRVRILKVGFSEDLNESWKYNMATDVKTTFLFYSWYF